MDWQETIADIIREKRLRADEIERDVAEKMKRGEMTSDQYARELVADIRREADRLEAAHKRESGDCAKLREFARLVSHMNDDGYWDGTASIWALVCKAKAALAAPPRNCERFQTTKQAKEAYFAEVRHVSVWDGCETERLVDWLLCTATEKEGGL